MKLTIICLALLTFQTAFAEVDVIYGVDNRQDIYQVINPLHKRLALSTAGMVNVAMFTKGIVANSYDLKGTQTLEQAENVCPGEAFSQQKLAPICSGFLVAPDIIVTAGHCYNSFDLPQNVCKNFAWVFDYSMKANAANPTQGIPLTNVYLCKQVVAVQRDALYDFSVIKLDRPVVGRAPLAFRTSGKIDSRASVMVIGHPTGLPTKVSAGGKITRNDEMSRFSTTLDTFHGNSGSAVFDANTGLVEGILIMGKNDYVPSIATNPSSCKVMNHCDDNGMNCTAGVEAGVIYNGEVVLRIDKIAAIINKALQSK